MSVHFGGIFDMFYHTRMTKHTCMTLIRLTFSLGTSKQMKFTGQLQPKAHFYWFCNIVLVMHYIHYFSPIDLSFACAN